MKYRYIDHIQIESNAGPKGEGQYGCGKVSLCVVAEYKNT